MTSTVTAEAGPLAPPFTFDVFISYSRRDSAFAQKLYRALTAYSPPAGLGLPQRRLKVFLDRADFTGVDYSDAVARHLRQSARLVVICSPNARAHPKYINDEIRVFVEQRGAENVIPVLLAGIPNNEARDGLDDGLAFPQALCDALDTPLARDFRDFDEGTRRVDRGRFEESWYFLLADIYGRTRADIEQRDQARRVRTQRRLLAASAVLLVVLSTLTITALIQRKAAVEQRASAVSRLIRIYQSNAQRRLELSDIPGALLWYAEALNLRDEEALRVRLGALLQTYPRLVRVFPATSNGCDFNPDSSRIACVDSDKAARIWDVATGDTVSPRLLHPAALTTVAFSPDGARLLTADTQGLVQVWNVASGRASATFTLGQPVSQAMFSPAGDRVVTAGGDGTLRVWDAAGKPVTPPMTHEFPLRHVGLSPDGSRIATILDDKTVFPTVTIWDALTGQSGGPRIRQPQNGFAFAFTNDHDLVYTRRQNNGEFALCEALSNVCRAAPLPKTGIESVTFSADGQRMLVNGADHIVRTISVATAELLGAELSHGPLVTRTMFSPDASKVLTIDYNNVLRIWDPAEGKELRAAIEHAGNAVFARDGERIAVKDDALGSSGSVQVWKVESGHSVTVPMQQSQAVRELKFSPDGKYLLVVGNASWLWELEPSAFQQLPADAGAQVWAAGFSRNRDPLLLTGDDRSLRVWDVNAQRFTTPPMNHDGRIQGAWFAGAVPYIVTQSFLDRPGQRSVPIVEAWDAQSGERTTARLEGARVDGPLQTSADGQRLLVRMDDGPARIWNLLGRESAAAATLPETVQAALFTASGMCLASTVDTLSLRVSLWPGGAAAGPDLPHAKAVRQVELAPDCAHVATIDIDDELRIWDTKTARFIVPRLQDDDQIRFFQKAVFSPDGAWVATQSNDGTARVWSAATGVPRTEPLGPLEFMENVAFSADGRYLTATGHQATALAWDAASGERLAEFARAPFLLKDNSGVFAWSSDARSVIIAGNAYIKDVYNTSIVARIHGLRPDTRSLSTLTTLAQLMSGRRIDESGSFISLTPTELDSLASQTGNNLPSTAGSGRK